MRFRTFATEGHPPHAILDKLSRLLNITRDGHFATVLCGVVDVARHELVLSNAGHFSPLLIGDDGARFLDIARAPGGCRRRLELPEQPGVLAGASDAHRLHRRARRTAARASRRRPRTTALEQRREPPPRLDKLLARLVSELVPEHAEDDTAILGIRLNVLSHSIEGAPALN